MVAILPIRTYRGYKRKKKSFKYCQTLAPIAEEIVHQADDIDIVSTDEIQQLSNPSSDCRRHSENITNLRNLSQGLFFKLQVHGLNAIDIEVDSGGMRSIVGGKLFLNMQVWSRY
ncbi:hypothetical protein QVD17_26103 [Tagetes erecta]|uniref:Uncharacterized protein n=1 Tax=Tagetes erecta TaxID=13708 RepID=A0AAD8K6T5_TARER|nr:hypothetical protein QVD17_26103 [Tagetes erecta]